MKKNILYAALLALAFLALISPVKPQEIKAYTPSNICYIKGLHVDNADEMEATPAEVYIYINDDKYLLDTKTNELTHITNF